MSTNEDEKQLELQLYYSYDYREADFQKLKREANMGLFSYLELLQMELDMLNKRVNANNRSNTR